MRTMRYIGHYAPPGDKQERYYSPAAVMKMEYICSALNRAGIDVEIVSASFTKNKKGCKKQKVKLSEHVCMILFSSFGSGNLMKRMIRSLLIQIQLGLFALRKIKRNEPIIVYHSLGYVNLIYLLKKIKKFQLILEIEEIYADVTGNKRERRQEMRLFKVADAYLFPTELLNEKINSEGKPSVIICGTYRTEEDRNIKTSDGKTHILYAGTFDPRKGGAAMAVAIAGELPEGYHVHIIGFGSEKTTNDLKRQIAQTAKSAKATLTYDGLLSGEEYIQFVQKCDIGLSTQISGSMFNDTSFPSKVLSYLANGLRVVSIRIKALERSAISDLLYYYDENTPEAIARAVQEIDFSQPYDSRAVIRELDEKFMKEIGDLLCDQ